MSNPELRHRVTGADARLGKVSDAVQPPQVEAAQAPLPEFGAYPGPNDDHMDEDEAYQQVNRMLDEMPNSGDSAEAIPSEAPGEEIDMGMIPHIKSE